MTRLEEALSPKTKAVMIAHTLGNPFDLKALTDFCQAHQLWLIEDNCDALGSEYEMCIRDRNMVVAPITSPRIKGLNVAKVKTWIPEGNWYCLLYTSRCV